MQLLKYILHFNALLLIALANTYVNASSPAPPDLRSAAVSLTGSVTLYWILPSDTGAGFHSYVLFRSNGASGPFMKIDSIYSYSQNSYTDASVNANAAKYYYYLITRSDCCLLLSAPSDTLSTIKLNLSNSGNGIAYLSWNVIHTPKLSSSSRWYYIYRQYVPSAFQLIDSTQLLNHLDTTTACTLQVNYRVEQNDAAGFVSVSTTEGDIFRDLIPPSVTVIDTVSVNPVTGTAGISWNANFTKDTKGYIVYRFNGVSWDSLSTVYGYSNTSYTDIFSNASNASEKYTISTIDSCNNATGFSIAHVTLFLRAKLNKCGRTIELNWNPYLNMNGGVKRYKIFVSKNSGLFQFAGSAGGAENAYSYSLIEPDSNYCFFVQAAGYISSKTSSSNSVCVKADIFKEPSFVYIRKASVINSNEIQVWCYVDSSGQVLSFNLLRSENAAGPFDLVASVLNAGVTAFTVNDNSVITNDKFYYYQLETLDSCGNSLSKSNVVKTLFTKSVAENNFINLVTWDNYEGWNNGTGYFNIYRKLSPAAPAVYIASVANNIHEYRDDVTTYYNTEGQFCYIVEAVERTTNIYGFRDSALSNENCNWQIPVSFIPNAFSPHGNNPVFNPVNIFVNISNYSLRIFNRWGEMVFETNDPGKGWTGNYKNREAISGSYVFLLFYIDNNGNEIKRRGIVTLLR